MDRKDVARFSGGGVTNVGNGPAIVFNQAWGDVATMEIGIVAE